MCVSGGGGVCVSAAGGVCVCLLLVACGEGLLLLWRRRQWWMCVTQANLYTYTIPVFKSKQI